MTYLDHAATTGVLRPPNHRLVTETIAGVTDPDHDVVTITITRVTQDEAISGLGDGDAAPDAVAVGGHTDEVRLRAERASNGDGRVYVISFSASDANGGTCAGTVQVTVPHDQAHPATNSDQTVNSFGP